MRQFCGCCHGKFKVNFVNTGKRLYQYKEDDFYFKFLLLTSFFSNYKFTSNYREDFLLTAYLFFYVFCIHSDNRNWNPNSSLLYWYNSIPRYSNNKFHVILVPYFCLNVYCMTNIFNISVSYFLCPVVLFVVQEIWIIWWTPFSLFLVLVAIHCIWIQCLGSWFVGFATFCFFSIRIRICESTDPDQGAKYWPNNAKKMFALKHQI